jgi:hypothetical protein
VRFSGRRFRLTSATSLSCTNDPSLTVPSAGFNTQTGTGTGTLTPGGTGSVRWKFVDAGLGGEGDSAEITVLDASGNPLFAGTAAPPGAFPGSSQPTGNNTAQSPPAEGT